MNVFVQKKRCFISLLIYNVKLMIIFVFVMDTLNKKYNVYHNIIEESKLFLTTNRYKYFTKDSIYLLYVSI